VQCSFALLLPGPGDTDMIQILFGVLAKHLALMAANWAFDNNFWSRSRRSIHIGWGHMFKATRSETLLQHESALRRYLMLFWGSKSAPGCFHMIGIDFLGFSAVRWYTKTSR